MKHKDETVHSNKSMATTMYKLGIVDKGLGKTDLAVRPDIWNVTTNEIYEIKPSTQGVVVAQEQLMFYIALANKYGLKGVKAGSSNAPGTSDTITLPDMSVVYWSPEPGVILYSKNKITNSSQFEYNVNIQSNPNNAVFWTIAFCFFWSLGVLVIP